MFDEGCLVFGEIYESYEPECGKEGCTNKQPVVHILFLTENIATAVCAEHVSFFHNIVGDERTYFEHPWGEFCEKEDSTWVIPLDSDDPSYCEMVKST